MLFKVKETQKVYEISLKGWDGSAWSVDLSNDLLTDMDYQDGMEMRSQKEFDEYVEWLEDDVNRYNNGGSVEWYERSEDQENDYEEFDVEVEYSYTDED